MACMPVQEPRMAEFARAKAGQCGDDGSGGTCDKPGDGGAGCLSQGKKGSDCGLNDFGFRVPGLELSPCVSSGHKLLLQILQIPLHLQLLSLPPAPLP